MQSSIPTKKLFTISTCRYQMKISFLQWSDTLERQAPLIIMRLELVVGKSHCKPHCGRQAFMKDPLVLISVREQKYIIPHLVICRTWNLEKFDAFQTIIIFCKLKMLRNYLTFHICREQEFLFFSLIKEQNYVTFLFREWTQIHG